MSKYFIGNGNWKIFFGSKYRENVSAYKQLVIGFTQNMPELVKKINFHIVLMQSFIKMQNKSRCLCKKTNIRTS